MSSAGARRGGRATGGMLVSALRKLTAVLVLFALVLGFARADDKDDLKVMQGVWIFLKHETEGKETPGFKPGAMTVTLKGDTFTVRDGDKVLQSGTMKLDAGKKHKVMDCPVHEGEGKGVIMLGIYELDGDTMRVCFDLKGKNRPTEFKTAVDSGHFLVECKRDKK
jgi:uncharacterized protein (TIGR03067 family)